MIQTGRCCTLRITSEIHFHYAFGFQHPNTRKHVRLLGPCFKTGRLKLFHQHPYIVSKSQAITQLIKIATFSKPFSDTHRLMLTCLSSEYTPCEADPTNTKLTSNVSLSAISRTVNSIFKVLFIFPSRYLFAIGLSLIFSLFFFSTHFELHSQTTRLLETISQMHW
ncbi:hypothetical protein MELLADRAFT_88127 [Melampsora larici-populina 98AG31]|uniref:Uncharacterized protein n=1 Tax=Melampsora larici-populina (strain 98AG31 / pathotype 3-4-7) TaxID=747676 RepID=F4RQN3_MELLP|nr:hypothetical protein MELLADRAFT_88127 [Melampsora larici-populina 98AG31]